jgi:hypothetical protein
MNKSSSKKKSSKKKRKLQRNISYKVKYLLNKKIKKQRGGVLNSTNSSRGKIRRKKWKRNPISRYKVVKMDYSTNVKPRKSNKKRKLRF